MHASLDNVKDASHLLLHRCCGNAAGAQMHAKKRSDEPVRAAHMGRNVPSGMRLGRVGTRGRPMTVLSASSSSLSTHAGVPPTGPKGGMAPEGGPRGKNRGDGCGVRPSERRGRVLMEGDASTALIGPSIGEATGVRRPIHWTTGVGVESWNLDGAAVGGSWMEEGGNSTEPSSGIARVKMGG